jgi:predicted kinase
VLVGLQASGKTTFYQHRFAATHVHVSKDLFRHNRNKERRQATLISEAFATGRSVVVDNTNPTVDSRRGLVRLAARWQVAPIAYFFPTDVRAALRRNAARTGRARVPDVAVFATAKVLQPPSHEEGFTTIFTVRLRDRGGFHVQADG